MLYILSLYTDNGGFIFISWNCLYKNIYLLFSRLLKDFLDSKCKVAKLFAKHMKVGLQKEVNLFCCTVSVIVRRSVLGPVRDIS